MKPAFVKTKNYLAFINSMNSLADRGAEECCLIVVDGNPGLGKTTILSKWAAENQCVYVRAKTEWKPYWMVGDILEAMRVPAPFGFEKRFTTLVRTLSERAMAAETAGREFALVIDEADHIVPRSTLVETVRDLADLTEIPTILVGMGKIRNGFARYPQISSRVSSYVGFETASLDDVRRMIDERCEIKIADDLIKYVAKVTHGYNREIVEAIKKMEAFGFRNTPELGGLTMRDMAGELIINDRRTGQPIHVPGVR